MESLYYFAGFQPCTPADERQKFFAVLVGIAIFIVMALIAWKSFNGGRDRSTKKLSLPLSFSLVFIMAIGAAMAFAAGFILTPWCN